MKRNEGITLIALVITIVILIILTAITINNVMNTNLFGLAQGAAENYAEAGKEEEKTIDKMIGIIQGWQVGDDSKIQPGDVVKITEKDNYTDADGRTATVPEGFKVSTKPSEQLVKDGLVIQDEQGNEFVWVPCYLNNKPENAPSDLQEYKKHEYKNNDGWKSMAYTTNTWKDEASETENSYGNASVKKYGGFYIGRYEAGLPEEKQPTIEKPLYDSTSTNKNTAKYGKPISKANKFSWNFISQTNAKTVSESMYSDNPSVQSKLVDGTAWDTVATWIEKSGIDVTNTINYGNYYMTNKSYKGIYAEHILEVGKTGGWMRWHWAKEIQYGETILKGSVLSEQEVEKDKYTDNSWDIVNNNPNKLTEIPTGSVENFKLKNIYDFAGNMPEWTTEISTTTTKAVYRDGSFTPALGRSCSIRIGEEDYFDVYSTLSFRVVLYIK